MDTCLLCEGRNFKELKMLATCSWMLKKIMELRVSLSFKLVWAKILRDEDFSINKVYLAILQPPNPVVRKSLVCNSLPSPRGKFCF